MWTTHNRSSVLFALTMTSLPIMVAGDVNCSVTQHIKFLCKEGERASRFPLPPSVTVWGRSAFHVLVFPWCQSFKDGHEPISNTLRAERPATAVNQGPLSVDFLLKRKQYVQPTTVIYSKINLNPFGTKGSGWLFKRVVFHSNAHPHSVRAAGEVLGELGWELLVHPPCIPEFFKPTF
jgi:hypothetical protein